MKTGEERDAESGSENDLAPADLENLGQQRHVTYLFYIQISVVVK